MSNDKTQPTLEKYIQQYADDPEFVAEGLAIKVTEEMLECLERKGLSQSWLAQEMKVSRAHISRIFNARPNMTLLTIAKIAVALGAEPDVCLDTEPWRLNWIKPSTVNITETPFTVMGAGELPSSFSSPQQKQPPVVQAV